MASIVASPTTVLRLLTISVLCLILAAGCSEDSARDNAQEEAFNFMRSYYEQSNVKQAIAFTADAAKSKLEQELARIEKSGTSAAEQEGPSVSIESKETNAMDDGGFSIGWSVSSSAGIRLEVNTILQKIDEKWRVVEFKELSNTSSD